MYSSRAFAAAERRVSEPPQRSARTRCSRSEGPGAPPRARRRAPANTWTDGTRTRFLLDHNQAPRLLRPRPTRDAPSWTRTSTSRISPRRSTFELSGPRRPAWTPSVGLEPTHPRLTTERSAAELRKAYGPGGGSHPSPRQDLVVKDSAPRMEDAPRHRARESHPDLPVQSRTPFCWTSSAYR